MTRNKSAIYVECRRLLPIDRNYGVPVKCPGCDAVHGAFGFIRIERPKSPPVDVSLCEFCLISDETRRAVVRRILVENGEDTRATDN